MYLDVWLLGPSVQASSSYQTCPCAESLLHVCWFSGRAVLSLPIWRAVASIRCAIRRAKIVAASIDIVYSDIAYSAFGVQKPNVAASIDIAYCSVLSSPIRRRSGAR